MLSVKKAYEIVAKPRELLTEQNCMKDFFNRSMRASQTGGDEKLNFREAERHVPGMFNVKATASNEHVIQDGGAREHIGSGRRKRGEILGAAATEAKDTDDEKVTNVEAICWNASAFYSVLASCLITAITGEGGALVLSAASIPRS